MTNNTPDRPDVEMLLSRFGPDKYGVDQLRYATDIVIESLCNYILKLEEENKEARGLADHWRKEASIIRERLDHD